MSGNLWSIILASAEGSFIQVTVFVGAVLLIFGYIDFKQQGALVKAISDAKKYQPLIGALLGITPGCGGAILVMPLYIKDSVTFGTVVATTIATAGDSAFVTMTQMPREFLIITPICLIVGTAAGYIVDYYKIGEWVKQRSKRPKIKDLEKEHQKAETLLNGIYLDNPVDCRSCNLKHIGHVEGDEIDMFLHHKNPLDSSSIGYKITHNCHIIFWAVISIGFVFGVLELSQIDINKIPKIPNAGMVIGALGTFVTLLYITCSKKFIHAQTHEDAEHKLFSLRETLIHNAEETAFVGTWVFAAYLVYELSICFAGGEQVIETIMASGGFTSILLGVLVGMIPGCGPQVVFVSLYLKGIFPFSALLANAISQDGDALFPLIAMDRNSAFWSTVINSIVGLIVGIGAYLIETRFI